jgi:hypothetical protein
MALRMVRGIRRVPEKSQQKSREEYLVACLREEATDAKWPAMGSATEVHD